MATISTLPFDPNSDVPIPWSEIPPPMQGQLGTITRGGTVPDYGAGLRGSGEPVSTNPGAVAGPRIDPNGPDWADIERQLREASSARNMAYDPGLLEGIQRNASYERNAGNPNVVNEYFQNALANISQRASNRPGGSPDPRSALSMPAGQQWSGNWFDDPGTSQLETLIKNQLNQITSPGPNDPQAVLSNFLMKRFGELANGNGYSPEERAILNTQALEPIEALRAASKRRALEGASNRGFLPTSGIVDFVPANDSVGYEPRDVAYDRMRTQANRDLAINAINERSNRQNEAVNLGTQALGNQRSTQQQALALATLLQQLPVQAMNQALAVLNGTVPPESLTSQVAQLTGLQQQQQQFNAQRNAQLWASIGQMLANIGRG